MLNQMNRPDEDGDGSVDVEMIRCRLRDYYGTAMQQYPMAVMDLADVDSMSDEEVLREARNTGIL